MRPALGLAVLLLLAPSAAQAACSVSASGIVFGQYDTSATGAANFTGTVTITCTAGSSADHSGAYTLALSAGSSGSYGTRLMNRGGSVLGYQLYRDAARTQVWGDGASGTFLVPGIDAIAQTGGSSSYTAYGRVPARQTVTPGGYSDLIMVTASY